MKKNRGCQNEDCKAYKKKIRFKAYTEKCPFCGEELVYVCKKCYKPLDDDSQTLCAMCFAKREEKKETVGKAAKGVGYALGALGLVALGANKDELGEQAGSIVDKFKKE